MLIQIIIGKNSNGENQMIDLAQSPLLMISYCEEEQLKNIVTQLTNLDYPFKQSDYYIASSRKCEYWNVDLQHAFHFYKDDKHL